MEETPLLETRGLGRLNPSGDGWLLQDVTLRLDPDRCLAIAGPSGAGKTLLLRALALLDPINTGSIRWRGQPITPTSVPEFRRQVLYLHQRPTLLEGTVEQNLRRPFELKVHQPRQFDRKRIIELLAELGRERSFLEKSHQELSGGEAQIVALLRALQLDPEILLLDEPTSALDSKTEEAAERLLKQWVAGSPRALLWVTHDSAQASRIADSVLTMDHGLLRESPIYG